MTSLEALEVAVILGGWISCIAYVAVIVYRELFSKEADDGRS